MPGAEDDAAGEKAALAKTALANLDRALAYEKANAEAGAKLEDRVNDILAVRTALANAERALADAKLAKDNVSEVLAETEAFVAPSPVATPTVEVAEHQPKSSGKRGTTGKAET
jgi:hypothetical protein